MSRYTADAARFFARAVVMPNTIPPIINPGDVIRYRKAIINSGSGFEPLMTFKITPSSLPEDIAELKKAGAVAGKYYPAGVTHNSEDGISDIKTIEPILREMEKNSIVLSIHGENPSAPCLEREKAFLPELEYIAGEFPGLKIVLEHISTKEGIDTVLSLPENTAGSITVHHLLFTLDDLLGGKLNPHLFCKPVVKTNRDREAIRNAVFSGNRKFFFGSDSAPHLKKQKREGAAGIYSSPLAIPLLTDLFEKAGKLELLESFVSKHGAEFYGLSLNKGTITLCKKAWTVPKICHGVVPIMAGKIINWQMDINR